MNERFDTVNRTMVVAAAAIIAAQIGGHVL
jgi:hypothetical protein